MQPQRLCRKAWKRHWKIFAAHQRKLRKKAIRNPRSAEVIIGKQRNGPIGKVTLAFAPQLTKFDNYADDRAYDYAPPA